jgi:D-alanyl-D-alanine-carboxypeptidase/D-alanyl-D-alanine-endopeptidase
MTSVADQFAALVAAKKVPSIAYALVDDSGVTVDAVGTDPARAVFEIGSVTKVCTGLLLAELVADGTVRLDDPAARYLDGADGPVTLLQLATHTSGLPRLPPGLRRQALLHLSDPYARYRTGQLERAARKSLSTAAGGTYLYSNYGYGLLGYLLGQAAGEPYETLIASRITTPLGLKSTGFDGQPVQGTRRGNPVPPWDFGVLSACGGLRSTAADMAAFLRAWMEPAKVFSLALEPRADIGPGMRIGLAWHHTGDVIWHNGATGGFSSMIAFNPARRTGIVALTNAGGVPPSPVERPVLDALR